MNFGFNVTCTQLRLGVLFGGLMLTLALGGCAHSPQTKQLLATPFTPAQVEMTEVAFFPQQQYQCGPAALATVLQYRDVMIQPDELVSQVYIPAKQGSLQIEMLAASRAQGLVPYVIEPKMHSLLSEVAAGNPVLVMQNLGFGWYPVWHYAVVVGYDLPAQTLILRSAETKRWLSDFSAFERTWARSGYWGVVVTRPDHLPQTAQPQPWLQSAFALEQVGQTQAAHQAYQFGHTRWPDNIGLGLALSNRLYNQHRYAEVDNLLRSLLKTHPDNALLWNNLAYALKAQGCFVQARVAAQCAIDKSPQDLNVQATWREMQSLVNTSQAGCEAVACAD